LAASPELETKASAPAAVDAYMEKLKHPLADLAAALRTAILAADKKIGEEIKWNAPAFFYSGPMTPFNPKEHRRHLVVFNFFRKDCLRLIFMHGDRANDKTGFLEGDYSDGRRLALFGSIDDLESRKKVLKAVLKAQLEHLINEAKP
jgi:hypothetical protein